MQSPRSYSTNSSRLGVLRHRLNLLAACLTLHAQQLAAALRLCAAVGMHNMSNLVVQHTAQGCVFVLHDGYGLPPKGVNPGFPRNPSLASLPLLSAVCSICRALPPVRWLFDLYCARVLRAGRIQRTSRPPPQVWYYTGSRTPPPLGCTPPHPPPPKKVVMAHFEVKISRFGAVFLAYRLSRARPHRTQPMAISYALSKPRTQLGPSCRSCLASWVSQWRFCTLC